MPFNNDDAANNDNDVDILFTAEVHTTAIEANRP